MKPMVKIILHILGALSWVAAFLLIGFILIFANFGPLGLVGGGVFFWILLFLGFACFSAPLTLRFFVKKHWLRAVLCAGIIVLFFALLLGTTYFTNAYLKDFTQEKWQRYPRDRHIMLEDLKENHGIIGMSAEEVIALLGEPNVKSDKAYTYYCSENSYSGLWQVEFQLEDGGVIGIKKFYYEGVTERSDIFEFVQTYINYSPKIRVREVNETYYYFTIKLPKDNIGLSREEIEFLVTEEEYRELLTKQVGTTIYKTRYQFYEEGFLITVDIYSHELTSLAVAEVEFANVKQSERYSPPQWFGPEITSDKRYKNANLARDGMPRLKP